MGFFAVEMKGKKGKCSCGMLAPKSGKAKNKLCKKGKGKASSVYKVQGKPKGKVKGLPKKYVGDAATYVGCYAIGAVESLPSLGTVQSTDGLGVVAGGGPQGGPTGGPVYGGCYGTCSTSGATHFSLTFPASGGFQTCTCLGGAPTAKKKGMKECARSCVGVPGGETCGDVGRAMVYALAGAAPALPPPVEPVVPDPDPTPAAFPEFGALFAADPGVEAISGVEYVGCFENLFATVTNIAQKTFPAKFPGPMSPAICQQMCKDEEAVQGVDFGGYFGVEYFWECWCGLKNPTVEVPASWDGANVDWDFIIAKPGECLDDCVGAEQYKCGDADRLSLYWAAP